MHPLHRVFVADSGVVNMDIQTAHIHHTFAKPNTLTNVSCVQTPYTVNTQTHIQTSTPPKTVAIKRELAEDIGVFSQRKNKHA